MAVHSGDGKHAEDYDLAVNHRAVGEQYAGTHWTHSMDVAQYFSQSNSNFDHPRFGNPGSHKVILHATDPGDEGAMSEANIRATQVFHDHRSGSAAEARNGTMKEIPIEPGHQVHIHGVTIEGRGNNGKEQDMGSKHFAVDWRVQA